MTMPRDRMVPLLRTMLMMRRTEEALCEMGDEFPGNFHVYIGQEGTGATVTAQLSPEDPVYTTHRGHAHNVARVTIQALAAVLGGCQSLHTNSLDEALALPTEEAATLALRTQQIIAHETGVADVIDPLGGSYFVESMTDRMESGAEEIFAHIDEMGHGSMLEGVLEGIERGWFQQEIAEAAKVIANCGVGCGGVLARNRRVLGKRSRDSDLTHKIIFVRVAILCGIEFVREQGFQQYWGRISLI
jgi:hypothetical protein